MTGPVCKTYDDHTWSWGGNCIRCGAKRVYPVKGTNADQIAGLITERDELETKLDQVRAWAGRHAEHGGWAPLAELLGILDGEAVPK